MNQEPNDVEKLQMTRINKIRFIMICCFIFAFTIGYFVKTYYFSYIKYYLLFFAIFEIITLIIYNKKFLKLQAEITIMKKLRGQED